MTMWPVTSDVKCTWCGSQHDPQQISHIDAIDHSSGQRIRLYTCCVQCHMAVQAIVSGNTDIDFDHPHQAPPEDPFGE